MRYVGTFVYEVKSSDVGKAFFRLVPRMLMGSWGRVLKCDTGKRIFNNGGVIQMENDEQRDARKFVDNFAATP